MAKEMGLQVEGCRFWWLHLTGDNMGIRKIRNDIDALEIALNVNHSKIYINVYTKVSNISSNDNDVVVPGRCDKHLHI